MWPKTARFGRFRALEKPQLVARIRLIRHLHFMRKKPSRAVFWGVGAATTLFLAWAIYTPIPSPLLFLGNGAGLKRGSGSV